MAVTGTYPDSLAFNQKANFKLTCDKTMFPGYWLAPIKWTGEVNGEKVEFEQISESGFSKDCYDFSSFSDRIKPAIPYIVEAIDNAMRVMD